MILGGVAGFLVRNGAVFLQEVRWISSPGSGDGVTPCEY